MTFMMKVVVVVVVSSSISSSSLGSVFNSIRNLHMPYTFRNSDCDLYMERDFIIVPI